MGLSFWQAMGPIRAPFYALKAHRVAAGGVAVLPL